MKQTNFHAQHTAAGAKMVEFAGFQMPIQYPKGIMHEHNVVRTAVGVFDVSHMGEFDVRGADALAFLQQLTVNDVSKLSPGKAQYSAMCKPDGGIVDDLLVYMHTDNHYMMVVNGACEEKDWAWAAGNAAAFPNLTLTNISAEINLLAIQGPKSIETLQKLTDADLGALAYYTFTTGTLAGVDMILSRTGYTGELGMEIYFRGDASVCAAVWDAIMLAGAEFGIEPVGLGARDTLRLEKGYCLYGNDIDETTHPLEAGLGWITKLAKGEFNGSDVLNAAKANGVSRKLVGLVVGVDKFIARHGYGIASNGETVGTVTSGNIAPTLGKAIAMGYVPVHLSAPGTMVDIVARGKNFPAEVVKIPFLA
ncbi:MAG: glycine cleavage system aminomethyltransferase GcvT [Candidatus Kapabacteria bacterium]|nr:glycine cleavage system aminomethyltransferase GcvT [Candidatus Kapabacteria bacterium]